MVRMVRIGVSVVFLKRYPWRPHREMSVWSPRRGTLPCGAHNRQVYPYGPHEISRHVSDHTEVYPRSPYKLVPVVPTQGCIHDVHTMIIHGFHTGGIRC